MEVEWQIFDPVSQRVLLSRVGGRRAVLERGEHGARGPMREAFAASAWNLLRCFRLRLSPTLLQAAGSRHPVPLLGRTAPSLRRAFGNHLRALRERRELNQERLGSKAGLNGKFVGEVERGESISLDSLWRVARAARLNRTLGVPMVAVIPKGERGRRGKP